LSKETARFETKTVSNGVVKRSSNAQALVVVAALRDADFEEIREAKHCVGRDKAAARVAPHRRTLDIDVRVLFHGNEQTRGHRLVSLCVALLLLLLYQACLFVCVLLAESLVSPIASLTELHINIR
jgi:hypothetical protein